MAQEKFTSITFEVLISGAWVNISADVLNDPAPRGSRGIMGNRPEDRCANPGRLEFALNNSQKNSTATIGKYSPGHANCLSGWTTGLPVRLSFTYKGVTIPKWFGKIEPDGIEVIPGTKGERKVKVSCYDYMGQMAYHKLNLLQPQSGTITFAEAIADVVANMPKPPLSTSYGGSASMVYVFDNLSADQSALSEANKLAISNREFVFVDSNGDWGEVLTTTGSGVSEEIPNRSSFSYLLKEDGDNILAEDGGLIILDETESLAFTDTDLGEGTEIPYGRDVINKVTMTAYPREIDAAATTVLWTLQNPEDIAGSSSITIRGVYRDPNDANAKINATEWVDPLVSGTDYKANASADGTGADRTANLTVSATFGAAEVELVLTNSHASTIYVGGDTAGALLQVRGKAIRLNDPTKAVATDATSIATHGIRPATVDLRYANQAGSKNNAAAAYITLYKDPHYKIDKLDLTANKDEKNMYAFLYSKILRGPLITETMTGITTTRFYLTGYEFEILPNQIVKWYPIYRTNPN